MKTLSADALWDFHNRAFLNYCPKFNSKELQLPSTGTCACFSWTGNWLIVYSLFALLLLFKNSLFALEYNTTTSYHHHICYKKINNPSNTWMLSLSRIIKFSSETKRFSRTIAIKLKILVCSFLQFSKIQTCSS